MSFVMISFTINITNKNKENNIPILRQMKYDVILVRVYSLWERVMGNIEGFARKFEFLYVHYP